jgi:hypothetical protein
MLITSIIGKLAWTPMPSGYPLDKSTIGPKSSASASSLANFKITSTEYPRLRLNTKTKTEKLNLD